MRFLKISGLVMACGLVASSAMAAPKLMDKQDGELRILGFEGAAVVGGAGITGFSDGTTNDFAKVGGTYTVRGAIGTQDRFGLELGYLGSAQKVDALGLLPGNDATLVGNGVDTALKVNVWRPGSKWDPYVLAGLAWRHYNLTGYDINTSAVRSSDDVIELPLGAGLAWRPRDHMMVDGRFDYRLVADDDLVANGNQNNYNFTVRIGYEF